LIVQLVSGIEVDFTRFLCTADGAETWPEKRFEPSGRLIFDNVSPGRYALIVLDEEGNSFRENIVLTPQEEWEIEIPVAGHHRVRVEVLADTIPAEGAYVAITLPNPKRKGVRVTRTLAGQRLIEVSSPHLGEVRAELISSRESVSVSGTIQEGDELLELVLDPAAAEQRFRVVDLRGQSVSHAALRLIPWDGTPPGWNAFLDEHGECAMKPFLPGQYRAYLEHTELGYHFGIPVEVPRLSNDPIEIVFAADREIELQIRDGSVPLPSVSCLLIEERGFARLPVASSDESGVLRWKAVGPGRFTAQIRQAGYWPTDANVEALPAGQPTEVQVRRLGDLDVTVDRVSGTSAAGLRVELESVEFGDSVATWIADGRVSSSSGSMVTDSQGRLSLTGLPRGTYRWAAGGESGLVEVLAGNRDNLAVFLP
jgi:hypothetical protein